MSINIVYIFGPDVTSLKDDDIMAFKLGLAKNNETNFTQRFSEHKRHCPHDIQLLKFETDTTDGPVHRHLRKTVPHLFKSIRGEGHEVITCTYKNYLILYDEIVRYLNGVNTGSKKLNCFPPRDEQADCIAKTIVHYSNPENISIPFLWNAKPRFGKTFTFYQLMMEMDLQIVLILTRRPTDTKDAWKKETDHTDFDFGSENIIDSSEHQKPIILKPNQRNIVFASLQDFDLSKPKFAFIKNIEWDMIVGDEVHFGFETEKALEAIAQLKSKYAPLYLSGTPFKILSHGIKFTSNNTYTWSYLEEQVARQKEIETLGVTNAKLDGQYYWLCPIRPFIIDIVDANAFKEAALFSEEEGFTFSKLFYTTPDARVEGVRSFTYKRFVSEFLDFLCSARMPYGHQVHTGLFKDIEKTHTLWYLPGVPECNALAEMLRKHNTFKDYLIKVVAGDNEGDHNGNLNIVKQAIGTYDTLEHKIGTITLTCGKLTHGVSIPEWGSVFVMSDMESAQEYFQLIFRGQTPRSEAHKMGGKYAAGVIDFSPSRVLKAYYELAVSRAVNNNVPAAIRTVIDVFNPICFDGNTFRSFEVKDVLNNFTFGYASRSSFTNFFRGIEFDMDEKIIADVSELVDGERSKDGSPVGDSKVKKGKNTKRDHNDKDDDDSDTGDDKPKDKLTEAEVRKRVIEGLARLPLLLEVYDGDTVEQFVGSIQDDVCKEITGLSKRTIGSALLGTKSEARRGAMSTVIAKFRQKEKEDYVVSEEKQERAEADRFREMLALRQDKVA
jgi:type III restriction/modification enzyme restriction subunit